MKSRLYSLGFVIPAAIALVAGCAKSQEQAGAGENVPSPQNAGVTAASVSEEVQKGLLDGRRFSGSYVENGESVTDTMTFEDGHFRSLGCDMYGFDHPIYSATADGDEITFTADATSATEGAMHWTGTIKGNVLRGKYVWTKEGQNPSTAEFTATQL